MSSEKQKKSLKSKILRIIFWIIGIILFIIIGYIIITLICNSIDNKKLKELDKKYSKKIEVNGHQMSFNIVGEMNNKTIVILPGLASPSPIIEFKPLTENLSDKYKIVIPEPFGYGYSDIVGTNRTIENIINELHECTMKLGIEEYYLMGHSLGGLYSLKWANTFPNEVKGFVGLDSSVSGIERNQGSEPEGLITVYESYKRYFKLGLGRIYYLFKPLSLDQTYTNYTDDELKAFRILSTIKAYNDDIMSDVYQFQENIKKLNGVKFPDSVPVLNILSSENVELIPIWNELHYEVLGNNTLNEVIILEGPHYIHFKQREAIAKKIKEWLK